MEKLQIEKANAVKAYETTDKKGKALLENLLGREVFIADIMDRIKSFADVCKEMGADVSDYVSGKGKNAAAANALNQWLLIVECFNQSTGETADWTKSSQYKYFPWMKFSPGVGWSLGGVDSWLTGTRAGARQGFLKHKHCEYCMQNPEFLKIYLTYFQ